MSHAARWAAANVRARYGQTRQTVGGWEGPQEHRGDVIGAGARRASDQQNPEIPARERNVCDFTPEEGSQKYRRRQLEKDRRANVDGNEDGNEDGVAGGKTRTDDEETTSTEAGERPETQDTQCVEC